MCMPCMKDVRSIGSGLVAGLRISESDEVELFNWPCSENPAIATSTNILNYDDVIIYWVLLLLFLLLLT